MSDSEENNFAEIQAQWAAVRGRIRQKIGDAQFKSWIKLLTLEDYVDQKVILSVPSNFIRTRILEQYLEIIKSYWLVQNLKINDIEILVSNTKKNDLNVSSKKSGKKNDQRQSSRSKQLFTNLYINLGSKNKLTPASLIGIINENLKSDDAIIGRIQILNTFSFFEIDKQKEIALISALNNSKIRGVKLLVQVAKDDPKTNTRNNSFNKTRKSRPFNKTRKSRPKRSFKKKR